MLNNKERASGGELSQIGKDLIFVISSNAMEGFPLSKDQIKEKIKELGLVNDEELILNKLMRFKILSIEDEN